MPGVPFTCVSIAVVVVCSTVCASAPVKFPAILTVGGEISGYWATGRLIKEIIPTSTMTMDITIAVTGLLIKVSAIITLFLCLLVSLLCCDRCSFSQVLYALYHKYFSFFQTVFYNDRSADRFSQNNFTLCDLAAISNYVHEKFSQLLCHCFIGNSN